MWVRRYRRVRSIRRSQRGYCSRVSCAFAALFVLVGLQATARATSVIALPMEQIVSQSGRILHARVIDVESDLDSVGLPCTTVTFDVIRVLKGPPTSTAVVKQYGTAGNVLRDGLASHVPGLPQYQPGEEFVVFLYPESALGFTSPVGLGQGLYRVRRDGKRAVARATLGRDEQDLEKLLLKVTLLLGAES